MRPALALLLLCAAVDASALRLSAGPKAEDKLRRFVAEDRALRARLDDAVRREAVFRAEARETDLRDAVAETPATREDIIAQLPGMKVPPASNCPTFVECHQPPFSETVPHHELLSDAIRRMLRPWLLLQDARGRKLDVVPAKTDNALLTAKLEGLADAPLTLNVSPSLLGGFNVWFDEPERLAALYERERARLIVRK